MSELITSPSRLKTLYDFKWCQGGYVGMVRLEESYLYRKESRIGLVERVGVLMSMDRRRNSF